MNDRVSEELLAAAAQQFVGEMLARERIQPPALNFMDFIDADGDELSTSSHKVAAVFGKHHDDLLRAIRSIAKMLPRDRLGYFAETVTKRENPSGGAMLESPSFQISRDGFALLVMGFTGRKALAFKLAYIDAFNAMAKYIKNQRDGLRFRCMELELEDKDSKRRGTHHAKGLNQRKREKKVIDPELADLKEKVQPRLV